MNKLPNSCATTNLEDEVVIIKNGIEGYFKMGHDIDLEGYNEMMGADYEAVKVMIAGSMFGWDINAVLNYEPKEA